MKQMCGIRGAGLGRVGLMLAVVWSVSGGAAYAETFKEAAGTTLVRHPALKASLAAIDAAGAGVAFAQSAYLPQFSLGAELNTDNYTRDVGSLNLIGREVSVGASQIVYDGGATPGRVDTAKADQAAQTHERVAEQNQILLLLARAYFGVMRDRELVAAAERNLAFHREAARKLVAIALIDPGKAFDLTQVRAREAQASANLVERKAALKASEGIYREIVGQAPGQLSLPIKPSWPELDKLDLALKAAQDRHPLVLAATDRIKGRAAMRAESWGSLVPRVDALARYVRGADRQSLPGQNDETYAGVKASYAFPLGLATIHQVRGADHMLNSASHKADSARRDVREAVRVAWAQREGLAKTLPLATAHFNRVSAVLEGFQAQYKLGRRNMLEVLIIQDEVYNSESRRIQLEYDSWTAQFNLAAQAGLLVGSYANAATPGKS